MIKNYAPHTNPSHHMRGGHHAHAHVPSYHGFCTHCCHPVSKCCCGHTECQKIPKELLVEPGTKPLSMESQSHLKGLYMMTSSFPGATDVLRQAAATSLDEASLKKAMEAERAGGEPEHVTRLMAITTRTAAAGLGSAVIGGGCCVHLSIEYRPAKPLQELNSLVFAGTADSDGTYLIWGKVFKGGYHIKECIISTNPGARLALIVVNAIARVRWCEIISC